MDIQTGSPDFRGMGCGDVYFDAENGSDWYWSATYWISAHNNEGWWGTPMLGVYWRIQYTGNGNVFTSINPMSTYPVADSCSTVTFTVSATVWGIGIGASEPGSACEDWIGPWLPSVSGKITAGAQWSGFVDSGQPDQYRAAFGSMILHSPSSAPTPNPIANYYLFRY